MAISSLMFAVLALVLALPQRPNAHTPTAASPATALAADAEGYATADAPRTFRFPADHGAHPRFRTEWWYLTGNLDTAAGRRFGYQLTIFRSALAPRPRGGESAFATEQLYLGHLALSDIDAGRFCHDERYARGAAGLAGAEEERIWLETWRIDGTPERGLRVRADGDGYAIDLSLAPGPGPALRGEGGRSAKSASGDDASYYYAFPRLPTAGTVTVDDEAHRVDGDSWYDREWSSSALARDQVGWDWLALHLADGRDLMLFQLRRADGGRSFAAGAITDRDGDGPQLDGSDFTLEPLRWWTSPRGGARYPIAWRIAVPAHGIAGEVTTALRDQEHHGSFIYWEGTVDLDGEPGGRGYLEMTGY